MLSLLALFILLLGALTLLFFGVAGGVGVWSARNSAAMSSWVPTACIGLCCGLGLAIFGEHAIASLAANPTDIVSLPIMLSAPLAGLINFNVLLMRPLVGGFGAGVGLGAGLGLALLTRERTRAEDTVSDLYQYAAPVAVFLIALLTALGIGGLNQRVDRVFPGLVTLIGQGVAQLLTASSVAQFATGCTFGITFGVILAYTFGGIANVFGGLCVLLTHPSFVRMDRMFGAKIANDSKGSIEDDGLRSYLRILSTSLIPVALFVGGGLGTLLVAGGQFLQHWGDNDHKYWGIIVFILHILSLVGAVFYVVIIAILVAVFSAVFGAIFGFHAAMLELRRMAQDDGPAFDWYGLAGGIILGLLLAAGSGLTHWAVTAYIFGTGGSLGWRGVFAGALLGLFLGVLPYLKALLSFRSRLSTSAVATIYAAGGSALLIVSFLAVRGALPAGASPATALPTTFAQQSLYGFTPDGYLNAWRASNGSARWRVKVGNVEINPPYSDELIPLTLVNGTLYFDNGSVTAVRASDGKILWHTPVAKTAGQRPVIGPGVALIGTAAGVWGISTTTGHILWHHSLNASGLTTDAMTLAATSSSDGLAYMTLQYNDRYHDVSMHIKAIRMATGAIIWDHAYRGIDTDGDVPCDRDGDICFSPAVGTNLIYVPMYHRSEYTDLYDLWALDAHTGKMRWQATGMDGNDPPTLNGNILYCTYSTPSPQGDFASEGIKALDASSGKQLWSAPNLGGNFVVAGTLLIAERSSVLEIHDAVSGKLLNQVPLAVNGGGFQVVDGILLDDSLEGMSAINVADDQLLRFYSGLSANEVIVGP